VIYSGGEIKFKLWLNYIEKKTLKRKKTLINSYGIPVTYPVTYFIINGTDCQASVKKLIPPSNATLFSLPKKFEFQLVVLPLLKWKNCDDVPFSVSSSSKRWSIFQGKHVCMFRYFIPLPCNKMGPGFSTRGLFARKGNAKCL
jgi:hypothetical protein